MTLIRQEDFIQSIADSLQYISYYHPLDFIQALNAAYAVLETRPWWKVRLISIALTVAIAILIVAALLIVLYGGRFGDFLATLVNEGNAY